MCAREEQEETSDSNVQRSHNVLQQVWGTQESADGPVSPLGAEWMRVDGNVNKSYTSPSPESAALHEH